MRISKLINYSTIFILLYFRTICWSQNIPYDSSFNHTGILNVPIIVKDFVIQHDGSIIVAGYANNNGDNDYVLCKYHPDGIIDNTFGNNGSVIIDIPNQDNQIIGLDLLENNNIVVATNRYSVYCFENNGDIDSTFGYNGQFSFFSNSSIPGHSTLFSIKQNMISLGEHMIVYI